MSPGLPQLIMCRPSLEGLPALAVPAGYEVRGFRDGDERGWETAMDLAFEWDPGHASFERLMRSEPEYAPERVKVAVSEARAVAATASCWRDQRFGADTRMLHWVATHPEHGGLRLGYQVSLAAMHRAVEEGGRAMALLTDDFRTGALKTYLRMGFAPVCTHSSHAERWRLILRRLEWPVPFAEALSRLEDPG